MEEETPESRSKIVLLAARKEAWVCIQIGDSLRVNSCFIDRLGNQILSNCGCLLDLMFLD